MNINVLKKYFITEMGEGYMTPPKFLITRPLSMKFSSFTFFSRISMTCDILDIDGKSQQIHSGLKSKIVTTRQNLTQMLKSTLFEIITHLLD